MGHRVMGHYVISISFLFPTRPSFQTLHIPRLLFQTTRNWYLLLDITFQEQGPVRYLASWKSDASYLACSTVSGIHSLGWLISLIPFPYIQSGNSYPPLKEQALVLAFLLWHTDQKFLSTILLRTPTKEVHSHPERTAGRGVVKSCSVGCPTTFFKLEKELGEAWQLWLAPRS